ncbi:hypothetical protein FRB90_005346 [Tulasnella sp. 427]|nr:hypothetical protein FRB90_005346 [Tulasnella sp. 427]
MSQRMNFFAQLQKQGTFNPDVPNTAVNADTSTSPSDSTKEKSSALIPSLNINLITQHHKTANQRGPTRRPMNGNPLNVNSDNDSSSSSSLLRFRVEKLPLPPGDSAEGLDESQRSTRLPTSRSTTVTASRASTAESESSDTPKTPGSSSRLQSLARRRPSDPKTTNVDVVVNHVASARTAASTFKQPQAPVKAGTARRGSLKHTQAADGSNEADGVVVMGPPVQTRPQQRKTSMLSAASAARVRSRSSYEMEDEIQLGDDDQDCDEPAHKQIKGEPVDDGVGACRMSPVTLVDHFSFPLQTAYSIRSSSPNGNFAGHNSVRPPSAEMIDVDRSVSGERERSSSSHAAPSMGQPLQSARPQPAVDQEKISLIESINDSFESYLMQQHQKAEALRKKWLTCSMEEWEKGGSGNTLGTLSLLESNANKFSYWQRNLVQVRDGMRSKMQAFAGINSRMNDHTKGLDEREKSLQQEKELLVKETGRSPSSLSPFPTKKQHITQFHYVRIAQVANSRQYSNFSASSNPTLPLQALATQSLTESSEMLLQVAKPLWPFGVAAALTFFLVSGLQDAAVQSEQYRQDPKNPHAQKIAATSAHH